MGIFTADVVKVDANGAANILAPAQQQKVLGTAALHEALEKFRKLQDEK